MYNETETHEFNIVQDKGASVIRMRDKVTGAIHELSPPHARDLFEMLFFFWGYIAFEEIRTHRGGLDKEALKRDHPDYNYAGSIQNAIHRRKQDGAQQVAANDNERD